MFLDFIQNMLYISPIFSFNLVVLQISYFVNSTQTVFCCILSSWLLVPQTHLDVVHPQSKMSTPCQLSVLLQLFWRKWIPLPPFPSSERPGQNMFTYGHTKDLSWRASVFMAQKDIVVLSFKCNILKRMTRELTTFWCIASLMLVH
jgi:hypothetical protein